MLSVRRLRLREVVFPHLLNKSGGPSEDPSEIRTVEVRNKFYVSDAARRRIRFRANQTSSCVEVWGWVECAFQTALGVIIPESHLSHQTLALAVQDQKDRPTDADCIRPRVLPHSPHAAPSPCTSYERRQWTQNLNYRESATAVSRC